MGYLGYVYVESKSFEVRSNVCGGVRLEERSKGLSRSVILAWPSIFWLIAAWDSLTSLEKAREKWRSFRFGSKVYVLLRRNNKFGNFLELSEYGEKGRRSFVIFPEGEERKGWMECRVQLSKLKQFHDKQKVGEMLPGGHTGKSVAGESGMIKGQQITSSANINVQGVRKSFADVVKDGGHFLNSQRVAGKDKGGEHYFENSKATVKPLEDALSEDLEQTEMTTGEKVDILTIRNVLSDFKKELFQCLERYLVGWSPPNAEVKRAKKGVADRRPKLKSEKPKPLVKLTYYRKKWVRPKTRWQKVAKTAGEGGESRCPDPVQAFRDSPAERLLEKGETSSPSPAGPSCTSPDAALGSPERDLAAFPLSSPACLVHDQSALEMMQDSVSDCDVAESPEAIAPECDAAETQLRSLEQGGRSPMSGSSAFAKTADFQCRAELYPRQIPPASDFVFTGERPSSPEAPVSVADGGENLQG
jgi:hypothetical protein